MFKSERTVLIINNVDESIYRNSIRQTVIYVCPTPCHIRSSSSKAQHLYTCWQTKLFVNKADYISEQSWLYIRFLSPYLYVYLYIYIHISISISIYISSISISIYVVFLPSFLSMLVFQCLQFSILFQVYVYIIMTIPL